MKVSNNCSPRGLARSPMMNLILLVFAVGVLLSMFPVSCDSAKVAMVKSTDVQIGAFCDALELFKDDNGYYPAGTSGLTNLVLQPAGATNWHQYLDKVLLDPWGHPYYYEFPGQHRTNSYDLSSAGPDGKFGTKDDIRNWDMPAK